MKNDPLVSLEFLDWKLGDKSPICPGDELMIRTKDGVFHGYAVNSDDDTVRIENGFGIGNLSYVKGDCPKNYCKENIEYFREQAGFGEVLDFRAHGIGGCWFYRAKDR